MARSENLLKRLNEACFCDGPPCICCQAAAHITMLEETGTALYKYLWNIGAEEEDADLGNLMSNFNSVIEKGVY